MSRASVPSLSGCIASAPQLPPPPHSPDGWPSCRGRKSSVASQVPTLVGGLAGEAGSQPGGLQGQRVGPMMGDTPYGVVARRIQPFGVTSFGRATTHPRTPLSLQRCSQRHQKRQRLWPRPRARRRQRGTPFGCQQHPRALQQQSSSLKIRSKARQAGQSEPRKPRGACRREHGEVALVGALGSIGVHNW